MRWEENPRKGRLLWVYGLAVSAVFGLILRVGYLDVVRGHVFREEVGKTFSQSLGVSPNRGWIYDKQMRVMAYNAPAVSVILSRFNVSSVDYQALADELAPILHESRAALLRKMQLNPGAKEIELYDKATKAQIAYISEHQSKLPGIHCVEDVSRVYPYGSLAGHILGYIQPQPASEAEKYRERGYLSEQKVGIVGVERQYESVLRGQPGYRVWQVTSRGVPIKAYGMSPAPKPGKSVRLTLDASLQADVQQIVMDQLEQVYQKHHVHPTDAEAVMLDTKTGGVLAMVSYPYYNPNWFVDGKSYEKHESYINNSHLTPIINHALASPRYPGSTVKPVNLLAAMATGVISPYSQIYDRGSLMVGTYKAHDWMPLGHGIVNVSTAIQKSCDTFMYQIGMWMANWHDGPPARESVSEWNQRDRIKGLNNMLEWEWRFGLGPKTGIDLPGEATGRFYANDSLRHMIVPYDLKTSEQTLAKKHAVPNAGLLYDNAFAAIGQMQEFTPLQLAVYTASIANNGKRLTPHVIDAILTPDGQKVVKQSTPHVACDIHISPAQLTAVQDGMALAVSTPGGTAYRAFLGTPYHAAGKTGTAEISQWGKKTDVSLFIGYAPTHHPTVALAVMVPGGGESSDAAVPLARKLFDAYFAQKERSRDANSTHAASWRMSRAAVLTENGRLP